MLTYQLSLVVPIYNEVGNIAELVKDIAHARRRSPHCPHELVLVNNGSEDDSAQEILQSTRGLDWVKIVTLDRNVGYGGGIQEGWKHRSPSATHVGWIPADRQYSVSDVVQVWKKVLSEPVALHKGIRSIRFDGWQTRWVSFVYSFLARKILGVSARDVNGLPKIFPATLLSRLKFPLAQSFHLDGQLLLACKLVPVPVREHRVTFHARRAGVSSWSRKRLRVYRQTLSALWKYRGECANWFQASHTEKSGV